MRLNPVHPKIYNLVLGNALYFTGQYQEALREFDCGGGVDSLNDANLAATYGQLGRINEARDAANRFVEAARGQLERDGEAVPASDLALTEPKLSRFRRQVDRDHYLDGLRKAGLSD